MRILMLANNWTGWKIVEWLTANNESFAGLVIHPEKKRKYGQEILRAAGVPPERTFEATQLRQPEVLAAIRDLQADIAISVLFGYIVTPEFISLFPQGVINLHPAYLPFNRGAYPDVWSIVEGTAAGVTLHYIDSGIDTGDIIAQSEVRIDPTDTGQSLYRKLEMASVELFRDTWPLIHNGQVARRKQTAEGSFHRVADVNSIDEIDLNRTYKAGQLIDIIRARTFPPHSGAFFRIDGRKIYLRLELYEDQTSGKETND